MTNTIKSLDLDGNMFAYRKIEDKKYKYLITHPYFVELDLSIPVDVHTIFYSIVGSNLQIFPGYKWDGASGPTIDTKNTMRASCVHDVLYQMIRMKQIDGSFKYAADKEFHKMMCEDSEATNPIQKGLNTLRNGYFYWAVRLFGGFACIPGSQT